MQTSSQSSLLQPKVAIYTRVSTHWQVDKDSLQVQKRELIAYCKMILGIENYVVFEDPGYSAKNTDRPDYKRMIDRIQTGEFSHLLVWKIDRVSRNLLDFATMYAELKRLGVTFVSKNEQFDTSSAIGEAMLKIILVFAELERNMTSERVTAVMISRANNGQWNGGRVPFGYNWSKELKIFSVNESEKNIVKQIYNMYEEYQSITHIVRYLNDNQIIAKYSKKWSVPTVYKILTNPFYIGTYVYNVHRSGTGYEKRDQKEWITVEDHHEPIITQEQFERISFLLKRNRRGGVPIGETYVRKNIHIFSGITRCGICGSLMSATLDKRRADGWRPSIYGCSRRRKSSKACTNKYVSDATIGPFVFNYLSNIIKEQSKTKHFDAKTLSEKLLKGNVFDSVESIELKGLTELCEFLNKGETGMEYNAAFISTDDDSKIDERSLLLEQKLKIENAMNRLRRLYLYGDDETPEKEYIIERQKMFDEIKQIDKRLNELSPNEGDNQFIDDTFIKKASYFVMVEKLLDPKPLDYEKYIRNIEPTIPRDFIRCVIEKIEVIDGNVSAIVFKNGMRHEFKYKN